MYIFFVPVFSFNKMRGCLETQKSAEISTFKIYRDECTVCGESVAWGKERKHPIKRRYHFTPNWCWETLSPHQTDVASGGNLLLKPLLTDAAPVISDLLLLLVELRHVLERRQELRPAPIISAPQATASHSQHCDLCHLLSCTCFAPSHYFPLFL